MRVYRRKNNNECNVCALLFFNVFIVSFSFFRGGTIHSGYVQFAHATSPRGWKLISKGTAREKETTEWEWEGKERTSKRRAKQRRDRKTRYLTISNRILCFLFLIFCYNAFFYYSTSTTTAQNNNTYLFYDKKYVRYMLMREKKLNWNKKVI